MKVLTQTLLLVTFISAIALTSCKKDEPVEADMTTKVIGTYNGDYEEGETGFTLEIEDVDAEVTKVSANEIKLKINVIPGLATAEFNATMDSETTFIMSNVMLPDGSMEGSGSLDNDNTLNLTLNGISPYNNKITYTGERK